MVSIKTVIAKVIRDTRLQDASYADDMLEWIPSAMGEMETTWTLSPSSALVRIRFHKGAWPCGAEEITSVTFNGRRMDYANPDFDISYASLSTSTADSPSVFLSKNATGSVVPNMESNDIADSTYNQSVIVPVPTVPLHPYWYRDLPDAIETNLVNGVIRVNYLGIPVDEEGYPLVPDNANYINALYYNCRMKLIEAGYPDPVFKWDQCMALWEKFAGRALGEIRYPTVDRMESMKRNLTRLLPPTNYYENFSSNHSAESYPKFS